MGRTYRNNKCFVPGCKTGYKSQINKPHKISLFKAPKDTIERDKWAKSIPRGDRNLQERDCVCENHFNPNEVIKSVEINNVVIPYQRPQLKKGAVPSIFPNCSKSKKGIHSRKRMPPKETIKEIQIKQSCNNLSQEEAHYTISQGDEKEIHLQKQMPPKETTNEIEITQSCNDLIQEEAHYTIIQEDDAEIYSLKWMPPKEITKEIEIKQEELCDNLSQEEAHYTITQEDENEIHSLKWMPPKEVTKEIEIKQEELCDNLSQEETHYTIIQEDDAEIHSLKWMPPKKVTKEIEIKQKELCDNFSQEEAHYTITQEDENEIHSLKWIPPKEVTKEIEIKQEELCDNLSQDEAHYIITQGDEKEIHSLKQMPPKEITKEIQIKQEEFCDNLSQEEVHYTIKQEDEKEIYPCTRMAPKEITKEIQIKQDESYNQLGQEEIHYTIKQEDEELETKLSEFDCLFISKTLPLDDIWAVFSCAEDSLTTTERTVLFSQNSVKKQIPVFHKQVILNDKLEMKYFFGSREINVDNQLPIRVFCLAEAISAINNFSKLSICSGGPSLDSFQSLINVIECAYIDNASETWRHRNCTLVHSEKSFQCRFCKNLLSTFMKIYATQNVKK
ncbi:hypothetical protein ABEB36_000456 [Hypothenemus hampei]|uniref:THAP-type domain-containing protein n=1 Tax=Hypothenemus hampei TaxID=57062 RepID=A0ABD1FBC0_HYPHA